MINRIFFFSFYTNYMLSYLLTLLFLLKLDFLDFFYPFSNDFKQIYSIWWMIFIFQKYKRQASRAVEGGSISSPCVAGDGKYAAFLYYYNTVLR